MLDYFKERAEHIYSEKIKKEKTSDTKFWQIKEKEVYLFPTDFPTALEFSEMINVWHSALNERKDAKNKDWTLKHPEFSETYKRCQAISKRLLLQNWLNWMYQSNFAQFVLLNHYPRDYRNKSEIDVWWQKNNPIKIDKTDVEKMSDDDVDNALSNIILNNNKK